jgi:hypothetical protein
MSCPISGNTSLSVTALVQTNPSMCLVSLRVAGLLYASWLTEGQCETTNYGASIVKHLHKSFWEPQGARHLHSKCVACKRVLFLATWLNTVLVLKKGSLQTCNTILIITRDVWWILQWQQHVTLAEGIQGRSTGPQNILSLRWYVFTCEIIGQFRRNPVYRGWLFMTWSLLIPESVLNLLTGMSHHTCFPHIFLDPTGQSNGTRIPVVWRPVQNLVTTHPS